MLHEAVSDGRLTMDEQEQRCERALAARTLGELAGLTSDLALPSDQPIQIHSGRAVTALFARERRAGRWVVPAELPVTAFFGDVTLDLREAIFASQRTTIYATAIGGQVRLIVPPGVAVEMAGRSFLGARSVSGRQFARVPGNTSAPGPGAVIQVRTLALGGAVRAITPRPQRRWNWRRQ